MMSLADTGSYWYRLGQKCSRLVFLAQYLYEMSHLSPTFPQWHRPVHFLGQQQIGQLGRAIAHLRRAPPGRVKIMQCSNL